MILRVEQENSDICRLAMNGRLDMAGVAEIEIDFTEKTGNGERDIVVDMTDVEFMASLGMRMFLSAAKKLRAENKKIVLLNPNEMVADSLRIAGFESLIPIVSDESGLSEVLKQS